MLIKQVQDLEIDNIEKKSEMKDENNNDKKNIIDKNNNNNSISKYDQELKWFYIIGLGIFHLLAVYSVLTFPYLSNKKTFIWCKLV